MEKGQHSNIGITGSVAFVLMYFLQTLHSKYFLPSP